MRTIAASAVSPNLYHRCVDPGRVKSFPESQFNEITDQIIERWKPIAKLFGGQLRADKNWESPICNVFATQTDKDWNIQMHGGTPTTRKSHATVSRIPSSTSWATTLVVTHFTKP